jgi:hypothetical protein
MGQLSFGVHTGKEGLILLVSFFVGTQKDLPKNLECGLLWFN